MTQTSTATQYFRTAKGNVKHSDFHCANYRRSITLGAVIELDAAEAATWAACEVCCDDAEVKATAAAAAAKADALCANEGVTQSKRIQSNCRSCGKLGTVNRGTGKLKAHKPQR
jgi:hypothetical protein